jgi:hypothetical protein
VLPGEPYPATVMPRTCIDTADAIELAETLQLIAHWLTADPERLAASLFDFIGHPAYGPDALHADLDRFAFLLGGNDGEFLLGEDPDLTPLSGDSYVRSLSMKSARSLVLSVEPAGQEHRASSAMTDEVILAWQISPPASSGGRRHQCTGPC